MHGNWRQIRRGKMGHCPSNFKKVTGAERC